MELSKEQFLQIIGEILKNQKDAIETEDFTFEFGEGKVMVKEKVKEKPKRWKPEMEESFYAVGTADGGTVERWNWLDYTADNFQYEIGNCFKTKEEAEFEAARCEFMQSFRDIAYEVNESNALPSYFPIWNGEYVDFFHSAGLFDFGTSVVSFTSKEAFEKAMTKVDQGELRKYYFGLSE